jgi:hypothetical protein
MKRSLGLITSLVALLALGAPVCRRRTGRTEGSGSGKARLVSGETICPRKTGIFGTLVVRAEATHEPLRIREF